MTRRDPFLQSLQQELATLNHLMQNASSAQEQRNAFRSIQETIEQIDQHVKRERHLRSQERSPRQVPVSSTRRSDTTFSEMEIRSGGSKNRQSTQPLSDHHNSKMMEISIDKILSSNANSPATRRRSESPRGLSHKSPASYHNEGVSSSSHHHSPPPHASHHSSNHSNHHPSNHSRTTPSKRTSDLESSIEEDNRIEHLTSQLNHTERQLQMLERQLINERSSLRKKHAAGSSFGSEYYFSQFGGSPSTKRTSAAGPASQRRSRSSSQFSQASQGASRSLEASPTPTRNRLASPQVIRGSPPLSRSTSFTSPSRDEDSSDHSPYKFFKRRATTPTTPFYARSLTPSSRGRSKRSVRRSSLQKQASPVDIARYRKSTDRYLSPERRAHSSTYSSAAQFLKTMAENPEFQYQDSVTSNQMHISDSPVRRVIKNSPVSTTHTQKRPQSAPKRSRQNSYGLAPTLDTSHPDIGGIGGAGAQLTTEGGFVSPVKRELDSSFGNRTCLQNSNTVRRVYSNVDHSRFRDPEPSPGPGSFNAPKSLSYLDKHSFSASFGTKRRKTGPTPDFSNRVGPGQYSPNRFWTEKGSFRATIGNDKSKIWWK